MDSRSAGLSCRSMARAAPILACSMLFTACDPAGFQKVFPVPGNTPWSVDETTDAGYLVTGGSFDSAFLWKLDAVGNEQWSRTSISATPTDIAWGAQGAGGDYLVVGTSFLPNTMLDGYLARVDASGSLVWERNYGSATVAEGFGSADRTTDGNLVMAGFTIPSGAGSEDVQVVKVDEDGDIIWQHVLGSVGDDTSGNIAATPDGGSVLGMKIGSPLSRVVVKLDPSGLEEWRSTLTPELGIPFNLLPTSDGGYAFAATESFPVPGSGGNQDVLLVKLGGAGEELWRRRIGGAGSEAARGLRQTSDGGFIIAGYTSSFGAGATDGYLAKTNSVGDLIWERSFGGAGADRFQAVQQSSDGGYVAVGLAGIGSFGNDRDLVYVVKTDSGGNAPPAPAMD